jgi:predicted MFS family arabinose efflux permease
LIPSLTLAVCVNMLLSLALGPFLPSIADDLGISVSLAGQVPAASMLLATALGLLVGPLADRYGYRRGLLAGLLSAIAGALAIGLAPSFIFLLSLTLVAALGRASVLPIGWAVVGARFRDEGARRRAFGWVAGGVPVAAVIGIPLLTAIGESLHWRAAFLVLAGSAVGVTILAGFAVPRDSTSTGGMPGIRPVLRAYQPLLKHPQSVSVIGSTLFNSTATWTIWTYAGAFYAQRHDFALQQIGLVYLTGGTALFLGNVLAARCQSWLSPRVTLIATRTVSGLLYGAALLDSVPALPAIGLIAVALLTTGIGAVVTAELLEVGTPAGRATTLTLNGSAMSLGVALGAGLGGLALTLGGYQALGLCALVSGLAAASVAASWSPGSVPASRASMAEGKEAR